MRRREVEDPDVVVPPIEVIDYEAWSAGRGDPPYGDPDDLASMKAAVARYAVWREVRRAWADANGVDEGDLEMEGAAPWDADAI